MERTDFSKIEYEALREEISNIKDRLFKLAIGGIIAIPSAYTLVQGAQVSVLTYSLPLLICSVALLYLAENLGMMRVGRYIRYNIEPAIKDVEIRKVKGWEQWLEEWPIENKELSRRIVDVFLLLFFYSLYLLYYVAAAILAIRTAEKDFTHVGMSIAIGVYVAIGLVFFVFLLFTFRRITTTS
jgi:hypothetical protein